MIQDGINTGRSYEKWWLLLSALLVIAIIIGGIVLGFRLWGEGSDTIEIIPSSTTPSTLEIYLYGAINNEGIYTFSEDDSLSDVLQGAGGVAKDADPTRIKIHIPTTDESSLISPQKININTAEAWLLEALPGIGTTLAQRIIEYRENEGFFQSIDELIGVNGIGTITLEKIDDKICVTD